MRFAEFSWRRQPEATVAQSIFQRKDHKGAGCSFGPLCINILKLSGLSQPKVFYECICLRDRHARRLSSVLRRRVSDLYPAFPSALTGHRESSCVREIREFLPAGDCSAGKSSAAFFNSFLWLRASAPALRVKNLKCSTADT